MRRVITGLDEQGRSCVISDEVVATDTGRAKEGLDNGTLSAVWETTDVPPAIERPRDFTLLATNSPPGGTKWLVLGWEPNVERTWVRTNTLDYDTVLEGSCELLLETGSVELFAGDMVMIPGTAHGWRAGPEGVVLQVVLIGLDPDPVRGDVITQEQ
jgi:hypothetical protein